MVEAPRLRRGSLAMPASQSLLSLSTLRRLPIAFATNPVALRHRFIDDHHAPTALVISLIEVSTPQKRDSHRLKIARSDGLVIEAHVLVLSRRVPVDRHAAKRNSTLRER